MLVGQPTPISFGGGQHQLDGRSIPRQRSPAQALYTTSMFACKFQREHPGKLPLLVVYFLSCDNRASYPLARISSFLTR